MEDGLGWGELLPEAETGEDEDPARGVAARDHLLPGMAARHRERPLLVRVEALHLGQPPVVAEQGHVGEAVHLVAGLAIKNPPKKKPKKPPKKTTKNVFLWVFLNFLFFMNK